MKTQATAHARTSSDPALRAGALLLLSVGLLGHLYAAHGIGGSRTAYVHHVLGFVLILVVTGGVLGGLGWRFWPARATLTLLVIGAVQAVIGLWIAMDPAGATVGA